MRRVVRGIFLFIAILFVGIVVGWFAHTQKSVTSTVLRDTLTKYKLISPLLLSNISGNEQSPDYAPLQNMLSQYIANAKENSNVSDVSVYFHDLNSGLWTGVNENEKYSPGSMLKIVTLMAYLKAVDSNPDLLAQQIFIPANTPNADSTQDYYFPAHPLLPGATYTNQQLLDGMITDSDNNAANWLEAEIGTTSISRVYNELDLPLPQTGIIDYMSPKDFSRFYRILYNSTYLSHALSEKTLELLTQTTFTQGLVSGVPTGTTVAHKFGERTVTDPAGDIIIRELHDCGIVYYPGHPYFLCVMTKGSDFSTLQQVISTISNTVWNQISIIDPHNQDLSSDQEN